jgi:[protein-PII] uridylyltransferase
MTSRDGYVLDTFIILDSNDEPIEQERHLAITKQLAKVIEQGNPEKIKVRRTPRNLKHFKVKTRAEFLPTKTKKHSLMEFQALDTPGLLATIGATFNELGIHLHGAKISTIGEKAEDLFILTSPNGGRLNEDEQKELQLKLKENISELEPE